MEMVFCFCHTEQWRETIQLINGLVVQEQWNIGNRQSCVEMWIHIRSESLLPILVSSHCISVYHHEWRGSNLGAVEHDRSQFSWHLQYSSRLRQTSLKIGKCLEMSLRTCWDPDFIHRFQDVWLSKLRQELPHSGHHLQNQTCPLGRRGSLCCR